MFRYAGLRSSSHFKVMGFTLEFSARSISTQPFERFQLSSPRMSVSSPNSSSFNYTDSLSWSHFKVVGYRVRSISSELFGQFSLNLTQKFLQWDGVQNPWLGYADAMLDFEFMGFNSFSCTFHIFWTIWNIFIQPLKCFSQVDCVLRGLKFRSHFQIMGFCGVGFSFLQTAVLY